MHAMRVLCRRHSRLADSHHEDRSCSGNESVGAIGLCACYARPGTEFVYGTARSWGWPERHSSSSMRSDTTRLELRAPHQAATKFGTTTLDSDRAGRGGSETLLSDGWHR
eukprot:2582517-Rhodomonas_salina.1